MTKRCVIFDFDGTLFDTGEGIRDTARYVLDKLGVKDFPDEKMNLFIGPSLFYAFNEIVGLDEERSKLGVELYRERYKSVGIDKSCPYGGMKELLDKLKADGYVLTIASSKPLEMVRYLLRKHDLSGYFDKVCAADFTTVSCDKADFITAASLGDSNVMVGDTRFDIEGGHKAGVKVIAAAYGFGASETLSEAEYKADSPAEVYLKIKEVFTI